MEPLSVDVPLTIFEDDFEDGDEDSNSLERERKETMARNYRELQARGLAGQTMMQV